jgi:hypothetical protein
MQIANIWRLFADGKLTEAEAQAADDAIRGPKAAARPSLPRPGRQRSPDRQASLERRRLMVGTIAMPPALAAKFTWGEQAVHRVIGNEVRRRGDCRLHIDAIAAMAGVHRTTVQNALRMACWLRIITREARRIGPRRNLTNIIRIVSPEWLAWLRLGCVFGPSRPKYGPLNKKSSTTNTELILRGNADGTPPWGVPDGVFPSEAGP